MKNIILVCAILVSSFSLFAADDKELKHFLGASFYYDINSVEYSLPTGPTASINKAFDANNLGIGLSYAMLASNNFLLLVDFKNNFKSSEDLTNLGSLDVSKYELDVMLDYLFNFDESDKQTGFFLGGGLGSGTLTSSMTNTSGTDIGRTGYNDYMTAIVNMGFMHTPVNTNFMYNFAVNYNYAFPISHNNALDLEKLSGISLKMGLHYAF